MILNSWHSFVVNIHTCNVRAYLKKIMHFNLYWFWNALLMKQNQWRCKGGAESSGRHLLGGVKLLIVFESSLNSFVLSPENLENVVLV